MEKRKLAVPLFSIDHQLSGAEKLPPLASQRASKTSAAQQPPPPPSPPDLLNLDGTAGPPTAATRDESSMDPIKQLEGLLTKAEDSSIVSTLVRQISGVNAASQKSAPRLVQKFARLILESW